MTLVRRGGSVSLKARPLSLLVGTRSPEVDLQVEWEVFSARELEVSPLGLLLGLDGSAGRALAVAAWAAGLDWTGAELTVGSKCTGQQIVDSVTAYLATRDRDLALVGTFASALLSPTGSHLDLGADEAVTRLTKLLAEVHLDLALDGGDVVDAHVSHDLVALALAETLILSREGGELGVCSLCGCQFVVESRVDERYCRRAAPGEPYGGRTCQKLGPQRGFVNSASPLTLAYRRHFKRLDNHVRRGGLDRESLDRWRTDARSLVEVGDRRGWSLGHFEKELGKIEPLNEEP
jgi:hypothetical protein